MYYMLVLDTLAVVCVQRSAHHMASNTRAHFSSNTSGFNAGADIVGGEDLIDDIKTGGSGAIQFDKCLATPDMMGKISRIARILGPRGLMPSPKLGTVVTDVATAVKQMKAGRVEFRYVDGERVCK